MSGTLVAKQPRPRWNLPPLAVAALSIVLLAGWLEGGAIYRATLVLFGVQDVEMPFLDLLNVLSSMDCHRRGIDVFASNACDVANRSFVYSPLWLYVGDLVTIPERWNRPIGVVLVAVFVASLFFLPRPSKWSATLLTIAAAVSYVTAYAIERANVDLVLFVLLVAGVRSFIGRRHAAAFAWIVLAALLKFYPIFAIALFLRRGRRAIATTIVPAVAILATFVFFARADTRASLAHVPGYTELSLDMFGARQIGIAAAQAGISPYLPWALDALTACLCIALAVQLALTRAMADAVEALSTPQREFFCAGALILCGCFFAGSSIYYRGIYLLMSVPGLIALATAEGDLRLRFRWALACLVVVSWYGTERLAVNEAAAWFGWDAAVAEQAGSVLWGVQQIAWWWLVTILMATAGGSLVRCVLPARFIQSPSGGAA